MMCPAFDSRHTLSVRQKRFHGLCVRFRQRGVAAFFARDFSGVSRVEVVLTTITLYDLAGLCDAHAFGKGFVSLCFHKI